MKKFLSDNFLLDNETAIKLFHDYAKDIPICDYHCHLSAKEIAENKEYKSITEIWLGGDHYKWRAMRSNGINEKYITGNSTDLEKFIKWAETISIAIGNPLYHWTHLELKRYFDIHKPLTPENAEEIYNLCNEKLKNKNYSAKGLISRSNVSIICTTDDPVDDLKYHKIIQNDSSFNTKVFPAFRPDKAINIDKDTFIPWITKLGRITNTSLNNISSLTSALKQRIEYFHNLGCRISDHALDIVEYKSCDLEKANVIFQKALRENKLTKNEISLYKGYIINFLGKEYSWHNWAMQIHIGALRNNNSRMFNKLGPDTGFDSVHDKTFATELSKLLDDLDKENQLPKTVLYVLNPRDNHVIGSMLGNFQSDTVPGKIQFGSGWWFCDNIDGMIEQIKTLSNLGLLANFIGMLTDSRSFISYTRHEYFRRILANILGAWVENGLYPNDISKLGQIIQNISYNNAMNYFGFNN